MLMFGDTITGKKRSEAVLFCTTSSRHACVLIVAMVVTIEVLRYWCYCGNSDVSIVVTIVIVMVILIVTLQSL